MNEQIQELKQQAVFHANKDFAVTGSHKIWTDSFSEKFAEMIVKEMCEVMKAEGEQFSLDQNFDAVKGVGRCMRKVKEHFGVEE